MTAKIVVNIADIGIKKTARPACGSDEGFKKKNSK